MTEQLQKAFEAVSRLPETEQDLVAAWILAEVESERRWDELFSRSEAQLAALAEDALAEHRAGRSRPLDLDEL
jgi:hypothetical protein